MISRARWEQPRVIDTLIPTPLLSFGPGGFGPGDHTDETILVDLPTLQETRLLIYGTSGSGKTTALYALLQQTYGAVQHIIVDKEGSFPKLREHFDYLLVSGDGEVPIDLSPGAVEVVLRKILETRVNAIIDLSDLVPSDQHEYVRRMATMMAHLSIKSPLAEHDKLVLVDEFQHFAPERGQGNASSTEAMMQLASLARKRGFCLVGATTRISLLSKSIVEMMDNKMIGRCGLDDAARAAQWLNFTKGQRRELSNLSTGTFYAFGPAISTDPVLVRSQSDLLVLPPRRGERRSTPATPAAVRDVLGAFDDIAREAETEARTIEELQTQVDTLTRQLRKAEKGVPAVDVAKIRAEAKFEADKLVDEYRKKLEVIQYRTANVRDEAIRVTVCSRSYGRSSPRPRQQTSRARRSTSVQCGRRASTEVSRHLALSVPKRRSSRRRQSTHGSTCSPKARSSARRR
jgi:GTPase SAR1 family protein